MTTSVALGVRPRSLKDEDSSEIGISRAGFGGARICFSLYAGARPVSESRASASSIQGRREEEVVEVEGKEVRIVRPEGRRT